MGPALLDYGGDGGEARLIRAIREVTAERCYLVAEIGCNHQGKIELAKELIDACAWAGVDCVKGQKRCLEPGVLFSREELDRPYLGPHSFAPTYGEHRAQLELDWSEHQELHDHAYSRSVDYTVSVWDPVSASQLPTAFSWVKVPSACAEWETLGRAVQALERPVVISTGATLRPVRPLVPWLGYLQCTSLYPTPPDRVDLRAMQHLRPHCDCVGFSGHHEGIAIDMAAVALGARVLERHVTLDRSMRGTDHRASLEPRDLRELVRGVHDVEAAFGNDRKRIHDGEMAIMEKLRTKVMR